MIHLGLYYISDILSTYNKNLIDFVGIPLIPFGYDPNWPFSINEMNKFILIQKVYNKVTMELFADACEKKLNKEKLIINKIDKDMSLDNTKLYFVDKNIIQDLSVNITKSLYITV